MVSMRDCPKYANCSVPVCPLDDDWRERTQMNYEPVCFYLQEAVKDGGKQRVMHGTPDGMAETVFLVLDELAHTHGHSYIRYRLRRASSSGSRIDAALRLSESQEGHDGL